MNIYKFNLGSCGFSACRISDGKLWDRWRIASLMGEISIGCDSRENATGIMESQWVAFVTHRQQIYVWGCLPSTPTRRLRHNRASTERQCLIVRLWNLSVRAYGAVSLEVLYCPHDSRQSHSEIKGLLPQAGFGSQTPGVPAAPMFQLPDRFSWPSHYIEHQIHIWFVFQPATMRLL